VESYIDPLLSPISQHNHTSHVKITVSPVCDDEQLLTTTRTISSGLAPKNCQLPKPYGPGEPENSHSLHLCNCFQLTGTSEIMIQDRLLAGQKSASGKSAGHNR